MTAFQVMPPLTDDERAALRNDIATHGVLVPVMVDALGRIIDGHNRAEIADSLGIPFDTIVQPISNDSEGRALAYRMNLHRRHLTREQRRALVSASIVADPGLSDRQHAERAGVSPSTAGAARAALVESGTVSNLDTTTGRDGIEQPRRSHTCDECGAVFAGPRVHCGTCGSHSKPGAGCEKCADLVNRQTGEVLDDRPTTTATHVPADPPDHDGLGSAGCTEGGPASDEHGAHDDPIARARQVAANAPAIVGYKAVERYRDAHRTITAAGGVEAIVCDLAAGVQDPSLWLADLETAAELASSLASAIRRRNLRSVR